METKPVVVVGAGPVGLMCALYLARVRKLPVIVIELQSEIGGLYSSVNLPWGIIDQGVHIPQETGVAEIDNLFFDVLPKNEWQIFEGYKKDIAGNIFAGNVDTGSVYPDLRRLPKEQYLKCVAELFANASCSYPGFDEVSNLKAYFESRFGTFCTENVFEEISIKLWKQPLEKMSPWAAKLIHLARIVTHEMEVTQLLKTSPVLDTVIGYPQQELVPDEVFLNRRRAMYPRQFGLKVIVDGFSRELATEGVRVLTSSEVHRVELNEQCISALHLKNLKTDNTELISVSSVVWTSPLPPLMKLLALKVSQMPDAPLPYRVVHLFLSKRPQTDSLYWLWSYDPHDCLVRVSSPHAYCADAVRNGVYPLCAEIQVFDAAMDDAAAIALAESQLRMRAIIAPDTKILGSSVLKNLRTFFVPTIANCQMMQTQKDALESARPENLLIATQDLNAGIFYMPDILCAAINKLNTL